MLSDYHQTLLLLTGINVLLERFILPRMDHVFAQSEYTRKQLDGLVSKDRLSMGTPGVDTAVFRPGRYQGGGYIFSVARFSDPRKNVPMLFKTYHALKQMAASAPPLVLAGSAAPSEADWNLADHLGIIESIRFEDSPSAERLAEMYREASVFVLSSNEEGFGLVLAEAMSSGVPVISTRCGGPESVVADGRTGYLTPVGDYRAMAERLNELLRDSAKRELMGHEARRIAERQFSIEVTGQAYIEVYDRLLNSVPRKVTSDSVAGAVSR